MTRWAGIILLLSTICSVANAGNRLEIEYDKSYMSGYRTRLFDRYSHNRIGVNVLFALGGGAELSVGGGRERLSYTYYNGELYLRQVMLDDYGNIIGAYGKEKTRKYYESINGTYFKLKFAILF